MIPDWGEVCSTESPPVLFWTSPDSEGTYFGGSARSEAFRGLDQANAFTNKKRFEKAIAGYEVIEARLGTCAGVRFNHGVALLMADRTAEASTVFQHALRDCSNYVEAAQALAGCYEKLGQTDRLDALKAAWSEPADRNDPSEPALDVIEDADEPTIGRFRAKTEH